MKHGSLFSGIGGFDLAAEWMGWENIFHCEWNPFGQKILKHYWPNAISYENICTTDFTPHRGNIDIISGGFPCQPFSQAGSRKGTDDSRYLWPEMLRCIREVRPRWIVGENVYGLVNWDGGVVFDTVCADLENEGFKVLPIILPAAGVNAPHKRDRIWFVAYSECVRFEHGKHEGWPRPEEVLFERGSINASNTESQRYEPFNHGGTAFIPTQKESLLHGGGGYQYDKSTPWENFPTVAPICDGDDGLSNRLDSITFSKWRRESIKGGGNAIVPNVVYQIFKTIEENEANRIAGGVF